SNHTKHIQETPQPPPSDTPHFEKKGKNGKYSANPGLSARRLDAPFSASFRDFQHFLFFN
ncbi:MAG: hypothetical protein P4L61_00260, partial [Candidatus Pacebacteria bacterium]|nr:hypothetical protein [Candidatus Paceibacterota bacterium]